MSSTVPQGRQALAPTPGPAALDAWIREAFALSQAGDIEGGRAILRDRLADAPRDVAALSLAGVVESLAGDPGRAMTFFDAALAVQPDYAPAHFNRACALLLLGDFARGWPEYEWRWKLGEQQAAAARPHWLGATPVRGRTLLLRGEQGLGDCLQFCRYVVPLAEQGASVILEVPAPLVTLLADLDGISRIIVQGGSLPPFDDYCPLLSLPLALRTTPESIPCPTGYLRSDPMKVAEWRTRLGPPTRPRIGLAWSGSSANPNDANRSIGLAELMQHLPPGVDYISLQKVLREGDRQSLAGCRGLRHFGAELLDFSDTAALCACLDLVVSVDTSVAHLSAGLGRPTWIVLPFAPAWRWLRHRADSPWYASATLYRQPAPRAWGPVLERVGRDICAAFALPRAS